MGTPEFPNLGKHCSVEDCNLLDFLPFTCDRCKQVFCSEHRSYMKHSCPKASLQDVTVQVCPHCAKGVRMFPNEDPAITWNTHINTDCDPSNSQKAAKKRRCPAPRCREILSLSNTIRCRDCTIEHCLKHRFGPEHNCPGPKKPDAGFPFIGLLSRSQKDESRLTTPNSSGALPLWTTNFLSSSMAKLSTATTQALQKAKDGMAQNNSGVVEECVQCRARFSAVTDLIEHVKRFHGGRGRAGPNKVTIDVCPMCSRGFRDTDSLVQHIDRDHGGASDA
ncbi:hypothetical protein AAC387_Pa02g1079 [Persea americana]